MGVIFNNITERQNCQITGTKSRGYSGMINIMIDSAVIQLNITEISDVVDVLSQRGIEFAYSIEPDGAFVYGTDDLVEQVDDILWAASVVDGLDSIKKAATCCRCLSMLVSHGRTGKGDSGEMLCISNIHKIELFASDSEVVKVKRT